MKVRRIVSFFVFLILVGCVGKAKVNDPTEEALTYLNSLYPKSKPIVKEELNERTGFKLVGTSITDDKLKYLLIFPKLHSLSLTKTRITETGLATLKDSKIWSLDIDGTLVTNKAIKVLKDWKHLEILNISYTNIDDGAVEDLLKLKVGLTAAGTKLSEKAIERLRKKMPVETEEYEIQCPGTVDFKCPEF
ncbi:putative lipoprotein [Leptospira santarosai str. 2000027870]|uniref:hypothetical protein n=1 Tax=Leptospira santarosai TaxID=28183 RepID=UPI0002BEEBCB|nr:hypothetical protein [Leptospira santarosai]AVV79212.1 Putative lipoprotein [Leptospira santarosai]EMM88343.1 putative lipoprotein [Leptospira santarosai str. 2000027870]ONF83558.1 hypothetical protein BWD13_18320 [Leptospira santarosai serovar Grippotyphosa]